MYDGILGTLTDVSFIAMCSPKPFKFASNQQIDQRTHVLTQGIDHEECDLFKGQWIPDQNGSAYTSTNCSWIPEWKNCFKHGRKDTDFINWRWKPIECELPRFDPKTFLRIVQHKIMVFVGDSVARNHMESLLCLLSQVVGPTEVDKDGEDRSQTMYFYSHNFTLVFIPTTFLVTSEERFINGSSFGPFNLHLDRIDNKWSQKLQGSDYAIISDAHWFFRPNYIYEGGILIGCVYCSDLNVTHFGLDFAFRKVFRTTLEFISGCKECKGLTTLVRTFSPAHFENGAWNAGGYCNKTSPLGEGEINLGGFEWELRTVQVEEVERVRKGGQRGQRFVELDVTMAMLMRPDGHPGPHYGNQQMTGINDCLHWCLPGPIDAWNDLLMAVLKKEAGLSLEG
ncbi:xyloglucan O-acetyltransferase 4-like [Cornus florida]|uniref:xyloglucan O-acetyltransferase 4-like n=1 Tax=Cornus florida TaxID=4283 RepID=UPI00289B6D54|nr:xyloglucan O-acetyltransferase 4-like [Cornus florida]